jgi:hypothetical protein
MNWSSCCVAVVLMLLLSRGAFAAEANVRRFALVIGNNQPEARGREKLRYADADAVATHLRKRRRKRHAPSY